MGKKIDVEVIGVNPPCKRCEATWKNVEQAASTLKAEGVELEMKKLDVTSKDVVSRYGPILPPAVALNGTVKTMGRIPEAKEVETLLREAAK